MRRAPSAVLGVWLALSLVTLLHALPRNQALGLYYDEAFMAAQARDFVEPQDRGRHPASVRSMELFGRPFPVRNAAYLGSLKSQLVIPAFAVFGASPFVLRTATLVTALLALLCAMLFAERVFGPAVAIATGLLIATDPGFYFLGQFEWGPFTTNLLCRSLGALLVVAAWQRGPGRRGTALAAAAGVVLGLGVFSRADFALILAAAGIALLTLHRDLIRVALRERRPAIIAGGLALLLCASPMLLASLALWTSTGEMADRGGFEVRSAVLATVLDGSHFHRLMAVGGRFDEIFELEAPAGAFGWALGLALIVLVGLGRRARRQGVAETPGRMVDSGAAFLLVSSGLLGLAMLLVPGAVRAHHQLNTMPLLQIIVALAGVSLWRTLARRLPGAGRAAAAALAALGLLVCAANVRVIAATERAIDASGGRGRWSASLDRLAEEIDARGDAEVVSLDWGFHENLLFLTDSPRLEEPIWILPHALRAGRPWRHDGDDRTVYLVHDAPYDLFGLGPRLLAAARAHAARAPEEIEIETHRSDDGEPAFFSIRILRPHALSYGGQFRIH